MYIYKWAIIFHQTLWWNPGAIGFSDQHPNVGFPVPAGQCVTILSNLVEHFAVPVFAEKSGASKIAKFRTTIYQGDHVSFWVFVGDINL